MDNGYKLLNNADVKKFLIENIGEESIDVIKTLLKKENVTDEIISEETGIKLNTVRKILYKLYDYRLASYEKSKDKEIGWYIYTWKIDISRIKSIIKENKKRILRELERKLEYEENHVFFYCKKDNIKLTFEEASERNFICPKCNSMLEYSENNESVEKLKKEIEKLRKEIEEL